MAKSPLTKELLQSIGYEVIGNSGNILAYPLNSGQNHYHLKLEATIFDGNNPRKGTEEWKAILPHDVDKIGCAIRRFKNLEELNFFHRGMYNQYLFEP